MGPGKTCWAPTGPARSHAAGEEGQAELLGGSCSPEASVKAEPNPDLQLFWLREAPWDGAALCWSLAGSF